MDYEKKYKEALERAKKEAIDGYLDAVAINTIFPELKESEDEKIRKELVFYLGDMPEDTELRNGVTNRDVIAWLEKQGEQNPTLPKWKYKKDRTPLLRDSLILNKYGCVAKSPSGANVSDVWVIDYDELSKLPKEEPEKQGEPKFKVGDWIITTKKHIWYVDETPETTSYLYRLINQYGKVEVADFEVVDKKARLWTIQDAKDGDVLDANGAPFIYKRHDKDYVYFYCGVNLADAFIEANGIDTWNNNNKVYPATKEQRDLLFSKMKEAGYEWDAENKELRKIEPNPAWSEEDRDLMYDTLSNLTELKDLYGKDYGKVGKCIDWLKSLKERLKGE